MMTLLGPGTLVLGQGGRDGRFSVDGGFLQVIDNRVRIVTEKAAKLA
jgi:F-type H+-transporting ATPase subunit epsilon